ncbi:MAG: energy transducer TonB [Bacteroidetes bacterium 4484_276]|nr:MAG: energy transducer TonB [Bacteroidetes bacterium 4484_276]
MEAKKSKKADLEPKKAIFMQIGLIFALAVVLLAFNYRSYEKGSTLNIQVRVDDTPEEIIPITKQEVKPPPPPPPKQVTVINIVKDDVEVEDDIEIDVEADQETVMDDFIPVFEEEEEVVEMEIFTVVESMPSFPGGDAARMKFLQENIKYPQMARESGIQGTVYVTFVVEHDGSVTDVRILRGIGGGCDEEAVRVINSMPKWNAGKQRGKPVRVQFNMPIKFTLQG